MAKYKSISTHTHARTHTHIIGLPDAQKRYTQKCFARACANGHAGCNAMTPQCHVTMTLKINIFFRLTTGKQGKNLQIK